MKENENDEVPEIKAAETDLQSAQHFPWKYTCALWVFQNGIIRPAMKGALFTVF